MLIFFYCLLLISCKKNSSSADYYLGLMDNLKIYQKAVNNLGVKILFKGGKEL
jgi:hypothetical protein